MRNEEDALLQEVEEPKSKFKKYTSIIIVAVVVLGLTGFGILDFVSGGSDYIIKVDNKKITPNAFNKSLMMQKRQYIYRFGSGIIEGFLNGKDFFTIAVNTMVDQLLIAKMLEDNGVIVNKATVNQVILNASTFKDFEGKFDRTFYKTYLAQMGISEEDYIQEQISAIQTKFFTELVSLSDFIEYQEIAKQLLMKERQVRIVKRAIIPVEESLDEITEKEILSYYIKNKERFARDEKRKVAIAKIDEGNLPSGFVSNADILKEYNKEYLYKNQKVSFYRLSFNSIEEAKFAENLIKKEGLSFTEVAKESLNLKPSDIYFKGILFSDLNPESMEEVSKLKKLEVSSVFYSNGFYNIIKLEDITTPAKIPSFESVKTTIANKLKRAGSCTAIIQIADQISKELESGERLEEVMKNGSIKNIVITQKEEGFLPQNIKNAILNDTDTYYGKLMQSSACEFYAYKINEIEEKSYLDIDEVKPQLIEEIKKQNSQNKTLTKAMNLYDEYNKKADFAGDLIELKFKNNTFSDAQIEEIWGAKEGYILPPFLSQDEKGFAIVKVVKINDINPASISKLDLDNKIKKLKEEERDKLIQYFLAELRKKYKVRINYSYIQSNLNDE